MNNDDEQNEVNEEVLSSEEVEIEKTDTPPQNNTSEIVEWTKSEKESVLNFLNKPTVKNLDNLPANLANWTEEEKEEVLKFIKSERKLKKDGETQRKQEQEQEHTTPTPEPTPTKSKRKFRFRGSRT